jgi:ABC-type branched-subunit amino acid transport system substrate-binding protein
MSSFFVIPMISWVATDPDLDDKQIYSTLSRTLGPFSKLAVFLLEVYLQYNWRRVVIISSNYLLYWDAGRAIRKCFAENNVTIAYTSDFDRNPPDAYIVRTLLKTRLEGRSK